MESQVQLPAEKPMEEESVDLSQWAETPSSPAPDLTYGENWPSAVWLVLPLFGILFLALHFKKSRKKGGAAGVVSVLAAGSLFLSASVGWAQTDDSAGSRPVTVNEYNKLLKYTKSLAEKIKTLEASAKAGHAGAGTEETVDLSQMGSTAPAKPQSGSPHGVAVGSGPQFKMYFDFNLLSRPGVNDLTFDNFHTFLMLESSPTPEWSFAFEVNPSPRYFELSYHKSPRLEVRAGKIWIPFDDLAPHNIFGGRVNVSRLTLGEAFLPDLWTDLGVAFKYRVLDSRAFTMDAHLYTVNGFGSGGSDPINASASVQDYPSFSDKTVTADNNTNKAFGGRLALKLFQKLGLGFSFYQGRWSDEESDPYGMLMLGGDAQLRWKSTELRAGLITMNVDIPAETYLRGGSYVELGQKFGKKDQWKVLLRGGMVQPDDRAISVTDQTLVGATILYQPGFIQYSLEHSQDIQDIPGKVGKSFTNARVVVAL
jgi:hypothetical protein